MQPTTIKIAGLVVNDDRRLEDAFVGSAYLHAFSASNNAGPVTWTPSDPLPPGLTLNPGTGALSGTPTIAGFYNVNFHATDGVDTIHFSAFVSISQVNITSNLLPNATQYAAYGPIAIGVTGGTAPYTFTPTVLPFGLTMDAAGVITGTPLGSAGVYGFPVTAMDSLGAWSTRNLSMVIVGVPKVLPSVQPYGQAIEDCTVGVSCERGIAVHDGGVGPFVWSATGLPAGLAIVPGGLAGSFISPGDGRIVGVPTASGNFAVQIIVTDADGLSATNTFPLHVSVLAFRTDSVLAPVGEAFSTTLRVIGGTLPYSASLVGGHLPVGLSFDPATLQISGTPLENGSFNPVFQFTDATGETLKATYYFNVSAGMLPLSISDYWDLGTVTVNSFYSRQLFACCAGSYDWSIAGGSLPPGMSLSTGGFLSGSSTAFGTYTFLVQVTDRNDPARVGARQFQLSVTSLSITTNSDLPNAFVGTPYSVPLTVTGASGPISWTLEPSNYLPPGIAISSSGGTWALSGTPSASGQFFFTLKVTDSAGQHFSRGFRVSTYPAGFTPAISVSLGPDLGTWAIGNAEMQLIASGGTGDVRVAGDRRRAASWRLPSHPAGSLPLVLPRRQRRVDRNRDDTWVCTPLRCASRADRSISIIRRQCGSRRSSAPINTWLPEAFVGEPYTYTLEVSGNTGAVAFAQNGALPAGMTLTASGVLSGTPTTSGVFGVSFTITDGANVVYRTVGFSVFDIRITTPRELPNASANAPYSTTITATGGTAPYTFSHDGSLPFEWVLNESTGEIVGTPNTWPGRYGFNVTVTDANHVSKTNRLAVVVVGTPFTLPSIYAGGVQQGRLHLRRALQPECVRERQRRRAVYVERQRPAGRLVDPVWQPRGDLDDAR